MSGFADIGVDALWKIRNKENVFVIENAQIPEKFSDRISKVVKFSLEKGTGMEYTQFPGKIILGIPYTLGPTQDAKDVRVYSIEGSENKLVVGAEIIDCYVVYTTDHFGQFAILFGPIEDVEPPFPVWMMLVFAALIVVTILSLNYLRKRIV